MILSPLLCGDVLRGIICLLFFHKITLFQGLLIPLIEVSKYTQRPVVIDPRSVRAGWARKGGPVAPAFDCA